VWQYSLHAVTPLFGSILKEELYTVHTNKTSDVAVLQESEINDSYVSNTIVLMVIVSAVTKNVKYCVKVNSYRPNY
jgi:hypothetical protein